MRQRKRFFTHLFILPIVLLSLFFPTEHAHSREIVRISNGEWPPYLSENLPNRGAASHIVELAFNAVGVDVEYIFRPWSRSYRYAEEGVGEGKICHGSVVWVFTPLRGESFNYSDVVIEDIEVLFHLTSSPLVWEHVTDLNGKIIGGTQHTVYPLIEQAERDGLLSIQRAGNYNTLFQRLLAGRIDAIPQVRHVGNYFIQNSLTVDERKRITFSETVLDHRKYHLIFSKKGDPQQKYLKRFNKGLKTIRDNGTYDAIMKDLHEGKYNHVKN